VLSPPGTRIHAIRLVLFAESLLGDDDLGKAHVERLTSVLAEAREIVNRIGDELGTAHVDNSDAQRLILSGDLDGAEVLLRRATEVLTRRPDGEGEAANAIGRARLHLARSDADQARQILDGALHDLAENSFTVLELKHQLRILGLDR
jgi:hypothetical protein